jgi:hypothetical protein
MFNAVLCVDLREQNSHFAVMRCGERFCLLTQQC